MLNTDHGFAFPVKTGHYQVEDFVLRQTEINRLCWLTAGTSRPTFSKEYSFIKKRANQKKIQDQFDWMTNSLELIALDGKKRESFRDEAGPRLKTLAGDVLDLNEDQKDVFEKEGLVELSRQFFVEARKFDPEMPMEDIFQASRNVWTAVYLQILLGLEARLTPAIFAYSMLYPITDNYLDDPKILCADKAAFNKKFEAWLRGEKGNAGNSRERSVLTLIQMIEHQFPRPSFPQVYEGLLAIFSAQVESTLKQKSSIELDPAELTRITMRKGGTSVLADGLLAAGHLDQRQMETIFDYGCFAQLMDDQEDIETDLRSGSRTLFTEAAKEGKLDALLNKVFAYSKEILRELDDFKSVRSTPLIQISLKGIDLLLVEACVGMRSYYSRNYLTFLEGYFPVSFKFLNDMQKKIQKKQITLERLLRAFWSETTEG